MAEFRKYIYALAVVALLAGLTAPASASTLPYTCTTTASVPPPLRVEGWVENVGDILIDCTGGTHTPTGTPIPAVDITITLSTHITSKITAKVPNAIGAVTATTNFSEALLIADSPNSLTHPGRPVLNCGNNVGGANAPDSSAAGPGVCAIGAPADPNLTYDGSPAAPCATGAAPGSFGCGRPNVFQGRQSVIGGPAGGFNQNQIIFLGVPIDQPDANVGTCDPNSGCHHSYRITNIRADLAELAAGGGAGGGIVSADLTVSNNQLLPIAGQGVIGGSTISILVGRFNRSLAPPTTVTNFALIGCKDTIDSSTSISFSEIEPDAFKPKNVNMYLQNWSGDPSTLYHLNAAVAAGTAGAAYPVDVSQNVPGGAYVTENSFSNIGTEVPGIPSIGGPAVASGSLAFSSGVTGIATAGVVQNGTRIIVNLSNIFGVSGAALPGGGFANAVAAGAVTVKVPSLILLKNQLTGATTGAAGLTPFPPTVDAQGAGAFCATPCTTGTTGTLVTVPLPGAAACILPTAPLTTVAASACATGQLVYEVIFSDPGSFETMTIPFTVSYTSIGLSTVAPPLSPGPIAQAQGHYAPWYAGTATPGTGPNWASTASFQATATSFPITRFWDASFGATLPLFEITGKCTCSLLFPYITTANGFDSAIEVANTSFDPGPAFGFSGIKQAGPVQFWYYSTKEDATSIVGAGSGNVTFTVGGVAQGNTQCTNELTPGLCPVAGPGIANPTFVPPGGVLTYSVGLTPAPAGAGNPWGLLPQAGFSGYIIAQASFQYCHGFAFISGAGLGGNVPTASYVALSLDNDAPPLTMTGTLFVPAAGGGFTPEAITLTSTAPGLPARNAEPGEGLSH